MPAKRTTRSQAARKSPTQKGSSISRCVPPRTSNFQPTPLPPRGSQPIELSPAYSPLASPIQVASNRRHAPTTLPRNPHESFIRSVDRHRLTPHRPGIPWSPRSPPRGLGQLDELELQPPPEIDLADLGDQSQEDALNYQILMIEAQFRFADRIEQLRRKVVEKEREYWERKEGYKLLDSARVEFWKWPK
ncbi:hypothetical protein RUND412_009756 [Rhizina undulata]